jgi:hypothetical protein
LVALPAVEFGLETETPVTWADAVSGTKVTVTDLAAAFCGVTALTVAVPSVVPAVKVTVAIPLALVVDVAAVRLPKLVDHATVRPAPIGLPLPSLTIAVISAVVKPVATRLACDAVKELMVAVELSAVNSTVALAAAVVGALAVTAAVPATVDEVSVLVATPLALVTVVLAARAPADEPQVTVTPAPNTLPYASSTVA